MNFYFSYFSQELFDNFDLLSHLLHQGCVMAGRGHKKGFNFLYIIGYIDEILTIGVRRQKRFNPAERLRFCDYSFLD